MGLLVKTFYISSLRDRLILVCQEVPKEFGSNWTQLGCFSFRFKDYLQGCTTSEKRLLILIAKQPVENWRGLNLTKSHPIELKNNSNGGQNLNPFHNLQSLTCASCSFFKIGLSWSASGSPIHLRTSSTLMAATKNSWSVSKSKWLQTPQVKRKPHSQKSQIATLFSTPSKNLGHGTESITKGFQYFFSTFWPVFLLLHWASNLKVCHIVPPPPWHFTVICHFVNT